MSRFLKSQIIETLARRDLLLTGMTSRDALRALIERLRPVSTAKQLIRLGPNGDGGYLVPNDLEGIHACFSPGVSEISGFEKDCADLGMKVFLADKSVDRPAAEHELFHFTKKFVGVTSNADFFTLDDWVASALPDNRSDLLLQIDIEGFEYEVFLAASDKLMRQFRIIVGEFHMLDQFWNGPFYSLASRAFEKILQTHTCVHIHPNNCRAIAGRDGIDIPSLMEFTFLRHDRVENPSPRKDFPHPLDHDNTGDPHLPLPKCWYGGDDR